MIRYLVWFDAELKTKSGKLVPFYNFSILEREIKDQELIWFHEHYGLMQLYRMHRVDEENFIAEKINNCCIITSNPLWEFWQDNPQLAIDACCKNKRR